MAIQIPGNLPEVQPLQPAPVGVDPDISRNVNNVTNESVLPAGVTVQRGQNGQTEVVTAPEGTGVLPSLSGPTAATQWIWVAVIIIIVAIGLIIVRRYSAGKRQAISRRENNE